jgi:hypothetical protein
MRDRDEGIVKGATYLAGSLGVWLELELSVAISESRIVKSSCGGRKFRGRSVTCLPALGFSRTCLGPGWGAHFFTLGKVPTEKKSRIISASAPTSPAQIHNTKGKPLAAVFPRQPTIQPTSNHRRSGTKQTRWVTLTESGRAPECVLPVDCFELASR